MTAAMPVTDLSVVTRSFPLGSDPRVPAILDRIGKPYIWTPVPKGLPRYRTHQGCHSNSQRAALDDARLTYVEGLALSSPAGAWFGHAWVTLDGIHAIDLTLRGQPAHWTRTQREAQRLDGRILNLKMNPATEYLGVEIPTKDIAALICENGAYELVLAQWDEQRRAAA